MSFPSCKYELNLWRKGYKVVIGADEVGRGAFAGPVVAGAVAFLPSSRPGLDAQKDPVLIDDSKKLTPRQRERAEKWIKENALAWGIGEAPVSVINRLGMAKATRMAFRKAISDCLSHVPPQSEAIPASHFSRLTPFLLIDAFYLPYTRGLRRKHQLAIVNGDEKCFSIAAASIIAKVHRDRFLSRLSRKHPKYAWAKNKGYGTREHREAIEKYGLTRLHRKGFIHP